MTTSLVRRPETGGGSPQAVPAPARVLRRARGPLTGPCAPARGDDTRPPGP